MGAPSPRAFWILAAAAGPPVALGAAAIGWTLPVRDPWRDLALLLLWSVAEEIVFRGALQPWLAARLDRARDLGGPDLAGDARSNLATSAVFAAFHLWRHPPLLALAVFPVSLVYGRARELSGRTWPAALLHAWFNLSLYAASLLVGGAG